MTKRKWKSPTLLHTLKKVQQSSWRVHEPKLVNRVKPCLPGRSVLCFLHHTLSDVLEQVGLRAKAALNSRPQQVEQFPKGPDFRELVTFPKTGVFHKVCSLGWHSNLFFLIVYNIYTQTNPFIGHTKQSCRMLLCNL